MISDSELNNDAEHPLHRAQRLGFGPLSDTGTEVWHGNATPCVSCCELLPRTGSTCTRCGQAHDSKMLKRMARHSGPWFVYDNIKPFPGVSLERIHKLVERGGLTRTSIVRGPSTYFQWRFATETPGVATQLGRCWQCQVELSTDASAECPACQAVLDRDVHAEAKPGSRSDPRSDSAVAEPELTPEMVALSAAAAEVPTSERRRRPTQSNPLSLTFFAITVVVVLCIVIIAKVSGNRDDEATSQSTWLHEEVDTHAQEELLYASDVLHRDSAAGERLPTT